MENKFKITKKTMSLLNYYFVFCPRYRRKIFLIDGVEKNLKEEINRICYELKIDIISIECNINYVYLHVNALPNLSPSEIMKKIKVTTSSILRNEFEELEKMPNLWTSKFIVSTEKIDKEVIKKYVSEQKTR